MPLAYWTDSRGLLGYFNPITGGYVTTPFLRLVLRAVHEYERAAEARRLLFRPVEAEDEVRSDLGDGLDEPDPRDL